MSSNISRKTVGEWLEQPYEWRIPVYQRHYAWKPDEEFGPTQLFWEIVEEQANKRLDGDIVDPHYFGAILAENKTEEFPELIKYDVVDGQQRLTTINVAMFAIIGVAGKFGYKQETKDRLVKYIFNHPEDENRSQKLVPTNFDCTQFGNLLAFAFDSSQPNYQDDSEQAKKSRVVQACEFFSKKFENFVKEKEADDETKVIDALIDTIVDGFELILIPLKKTDEAQKVFESLNNTARPLTTFDLIRNDIFYRADKDDRGSDVKLFNSDLWQQFEGTFWEQEHPGRSNKSTHIEAYIARMLMAKNEEHLLMNRNAIFKEYKKFAEKQRSLGVRALREIEIISDYVDVYKYLVGETRKNPIGDDFDFGHFMHATSKDMSLYPTLFIIARCDVSIEERQQMMRLLESFVIRRHICKLTSKHYNRIAPVIFSDAGNKPSYKALYAYLTDLQENETRLFPSDKDVVYACLREDFYARNHLKDYVFRRIVDRETGPYNERRKVEPITIDHIIPKTWRNKDGWKSALADFDENEVDQKIGTIGNLTPMSRARNSAKSNHDWGGEDGARARLRQCDLKLTSSLADKESWGLDDINARSKELAAIICKIWPKDIPPGD